MDDEDEDDMFVAQDGGERRAAPTGYNPLYLPEVDPLAFLEFHKWLLKDDLKVDDADLLVKTYLLAHQFRAEGFRNALLDDVRDFFASHRSTRVNLDSMLDLATLLEPGHVPHRGKNRLLEFLVWQLTFEIIMRGWEHYENNDTFHNLLQASPIIVKWHLKALHEMNPSAAAIKMRKKKAQKERAREDAAAGRRIKRPTDTSDEEYVDEDKKEPGGKKKPRLSAPFKWPENPSEKVGCVFHEHLDSRDCSDQLGMEGRRRRMIVIDA